MSKARCGYNLGPTREPCG